MQRYEYDNGQGTTFTLDFYPDAAVIPATHRKIAYEENNPPQGNIIRQQHQRAGLTFAIGKLNEIDDTAREYCSKQEQNVLSYTSKKTGGTVPICLLGPNKEGSAHAFYLTQVESEKGRHLVQIFKDFDSNTTDKKQLEELSGEIDLKNYTKDIIHILRSIEEKRS